MSTTFLISDTHFGHSNILDFKQANGEPVRPFKSVVEMDETMIENWNRVVKPEDKIYHLGDVAFKVATLRTLERLNGRKVLIKGNHDTLKPSQYAKYFYDVRGYHIMDKCLLSHIPIHPSSMSRWRRNIHGHLHNNLVMLDGQPDERYINVCVEQINYTPIPWDVVRQSYDGFTNVHDYLRWGGHVK